MTWQGVLLVGFIRFVLAAKSKFPPGGGRDHTRLTYRHAGRDFRLTDVHGNVVQELLA